MKVKCKINNVNHFEDEFLRGRLLKYKDEDSGEVYLTVGKIYTVYALMFINNYPLYLICSEYDDECPYSYDPAFFDVVDKRLSSYWELSFSECEKYGCSTSIVFDEWAKDPMFYEELIDGLTERIQIFSHYKKLMDEEFIDFNQIEKEIQIEVIGEIKQGEYTGEYLKIFEDKEQGQGYYLKQFSNPQFANSPDYDNWFESYENLERYFKLKGWKVKWSNK